MNKKFFAYIMGLMGFSILAIIIIQIIWINRAINVKNELFDRSIIEALAESAKGIEDMRGERMWANFADMDSLSWTNYNSSRRASPFDIFRDNGRNRNNDRDGDNDVNREALSSDNNESPNTNESVRRGDDHLPLNDQDTIIAKTRKMFRTSMGRIDSLSKIAESLRINTPEMQAQLDFQKEKLKEVTNQIVSEVNSFNNNLVSRDEMYQIVNDELQERKIQIDFDFALMQHDTIISMSEQADSLALTTTKYKARLFSRNIFERDQSLAIFLPTQSEFIYRSVFWLLAASLIFSLIVLLTFALSIYFMLKQKKISEMKSDFINNMTHEFKTPIATISVAADTILNNKVITQPDKINYFVDMIKKENTRMNRQVEDILAIARLDKKEFEFKWEPFNVHDTIEDVVQSIILQVESRGGTITSHLKASNPTITSDKNHCSSVIYNLLDNANKYSPDKPEIIIETKNTNNGIIISVEDHGIGMSKSVQAKIFERFYRQTSGNIHNVKGFGLGLSYAKAVVEANKGNITVHSELGKGSRFDVFLPFLREA